MRITPLAVWARNLSTSELEQVVVADVSFTHSKKDMWDIVSCYCLAIQVLLKNPEDPNRVQLALEAVREYANRFYTSNLLKEWLVQAEQLCKVAR
mmetsp:Transcript_28746/g.33786  ORF Transcript_28746/g.33786 Transcript_28746/m.33786 type:complete len:95 (-) Transcript_28746:196-480(-)